MVKRMRQNSGLSERPLDRRDFLRQLAAIGAGAGALAPLQLQGSDRIASKTFPARPLPGTDLVISVLAPGGWHIGAVSERESEQIVRATLDEGGRFFDTARSYQGGESETRLGKFIPASMRDDVVVLTKSEARTPDRLQEEFEGSLRRLRRDRIEIYFAHAVPNPRQADQFFESGAFEYVAKQRELGRIGCLGFSGHYTSAGLLRMIERGKEFGADFRAALLPVNPVDASNKDSFLRNVFPKLLENGITPLAMKTACWGQLLNVLPDSVSRQDLFRFALSMPIGSWVSGVRSVSELKENMALARESISWGEAERNAIIDKFAQHAGDTSIEIYRGWG